MSSLIKWDKLYIKGAWVEPAGSGTIEVINPATEEVAGTIPKGTAEDIDRAVAAARAAFDSWYQTNLDMRVKHLQAITAQLRAHQDQLAYTMSTEMGMPLTLSKMVQAGAAIMVFTFMPMVLQQAQFEEQIGSSLVVKEPVGIVGCITPWNYPLYQIAAKASCSARAAASTPATRGPPFTRPRPTSCTAKSSWR